MTSDKRIGSNGRLHKVSLDDLSGVLAELDELAESLEPAPSGHGPVAPAVPPAPVTFVATMVQGFPGQDPGAPTLGPLRRFGAGPTE